MRSPSSVLAVLAVLWVLFPSCSSDKRDQGDAGTDTDTDTDSDTDTDGDSDSDEWCPELSTSCGDPTALESCGDDTLGAPRLIAPLSGKYVRDRRPEIIWDGASSGVSQYRVEIARDRAFTEVVYRSTTYEGYPGIANRFRHVVTCDLDCGVHFFRVLSVTAPECEVGVSTYTWEMYVGMAPYDLDRDGVPDMMCWRVEEAGGEFEKDKIQGYAIFDLDEKGGQTLTLDDLVKVVEWEEEPPSDGISFTIHNIGDFNGDDYPDLGINYGLFNEATAEFRILVFTAITQDAVQTKTDAIVDIVPSSAVDGNLGIPNVYSSSFSFSDINGDGLSDLFLGDGMGAYFLFGTTTGFAGSATESDVFVYSSDVDQSWSPYSMMDINGDGFADLIIDTENMSGEAPLGAVVRFGADDLVGSIDILSDAVIIRDTVDPIVYGNWNIFSPFLTRGSVLGDIDFDGYPEMGFTSLAVDVTGYCEETDGPISTGGVLVFEDFPTPEDVNYSDMIATAIVGDFPIGDTETGTEKVGNKIVSSDLNDDDVADVAFITSHARIFEFDGRTIWDDFYFASQADGIEGPYGSGEAFLYGYLADIDGDGILEQSMYPDSTCTGSLISLSSTGEPICIPNDIYNYCQYGQGLLLPMQLM